MPTGIPYCDETWNPVVGCTKIKSGCQNCWAEKLHMKRYIGWTSGRWPDAPTQYHKPFSEVQLLPDRLRQPLHWRKPRTIFVNSMSDTFHEDVPFEFVDKMFAIMKQRPRHTFMLFTKRWERAAEYFRTIRHKMQPVNVHPYFSASTQAEVDEAVPILLKIHVAVRGLSLEPLLGPASFLQWVYENSCGCTDWDVTRESNKRFRCVHCRDSLAVCGLDSIIVGCESGPKRRHCKIEWIESVVNQCKDAGVPCYVKQIDTTDLVPAGVLKNKVSTKPEEWPKCLRVREMPK